MGGMKITIKRKNGQQQDIEAGEGKTILAALLEYGITDVGAPCGGRGRCGKCTVLVEGEGEMLACMTPVREGMCVATGYTEEDVISEHGKGCRVLPDGDAGLVAACDIGTTTVVCHLLDGKSGEKLGTTSAPSAQRGFGADVL
jgi:uncharacterized 2Fe-2S/4Fe-4S cluster protein (DUF4445 family)